VLIEANITEDGAVNQYELFNTNRFAAVKPLSDKYYNILAENRIIRNLERRLFQEVILSKVSDNAWNLSPPAKQDIYDILTTRQPGITSLPINMVMIYAFDRPFPSGKQRVDKSLPYINILATDLSYAADVRRNLTRIFEPNRACDVNENLSFVMKKWFIPTVRLPQDIKPKLIPLLNLRQDITIANKCSINPNTKQESFWWEVTQNQYTGDIIEDPKVPEGVVFFTWSEKVTDDLIGYSLITFYIIVVLGIGRALRSVIQTDSNAIFIKDMPRPDSLLLICEGILISRMENNLEREEELFYVLIDIMRSPEILKMITDSSLKKKNE
jgi:hypothetical protein